MSSIRLLAPTGAFGLKLLQQELKGSSGKNVLVSPLSVSVAMAMTMNGARGKTRKSIAAGLDLPDFGSVATTNLSYANLLAELNNKDALGVELAVANAIWGKQEFAFSPAFLQAVQTHFNAKVTSADFADPATLAEINKWAAENTNNRIPKILDEISPEKILFLLNAVYFKGEWNVKFDKSLTTEADFFAPTGTRKHPLMQRDGYMVYERGENYQAVKLPFGSTKRVNLCVYLPAPDVSVESFVAGLTQGTLRNLLVLEEETEGTLFLPRFKLDYDVSLNDSLKALGMGDAFDSGKADFSALASGPIFISEVKHKTFASFDEEGGEAAAVTSVGVGIESVPVTFNMRCDRPFVIALQDQVTGCVLFTGVVNDPQ